MSDQHAATESLASRSRPVLAKVRCPQCTKLLGRMALQAGSAVELKCRNCGRLVTFVGGPGPSSPSRP